jgi:hypothetical protein
MRLETFTDGLAKSLAVLACLGVAACGSGKPDVGNATAAPEAPRETRSAVLDPVHVLITLPRGAVAPTDYLPALQALRSSGAQVLLLSAQPTPKPGGFESLAIVSFARQADFDAWLNGAGGRLGAALRVRRADVLAHDGDAGTPASGSFYVVNHYEALVSPDEYRTYTQKYVVPNMANQKATGAMVAYTMYLEREPDGTNPKAVLIKEYLSGADQIRAEEAKEKYKQDVLLKQAEWKQIHESKSTIRHDLTETFAVAVQ